MSERILLVVMLAALCSSLGAETLSDPMRPWQPVAAPVQTRARSLYDLNAILYSAQRRVAVINGRTVSEGDRIGAAHVRRINRRSLELEERGRLIRLVLSPARSGSGSSE